MPEVEENNPKVKEDKSVQTELWASLRVFGQPLQVSSTFGKEVILKARFGNLNLGDIIAKLVELATHEKGFSLEPPWNVVNQINLSNLILQINLTARKIGIEYELNGLNLVFLKIDSVGVWFSLQGGKSVDLNIVGQFLGQNYPAGRPLTWDLLSESPPSVPGSGAKVFDLDYLGIGQHVSLTDTRDLNTVAGVITALKESVLPVPNNRQNPLTQMRRLKFNPASHWLIGAKFTIIETVTLGAVFNDPELYGLLVELAGEKAKSFAGLSFQILYKKVTDNIGVYSIVLELPAAMRQLEFGAVSVTLPVVGLDIYTNGNFRIDCGFPKNGDFSISFAIQAFPYIGSGGFYLALLEGATSKTTPQNAPGRFAPVIEFGFGLQLGLGKTIEKGVLKAGLSLTVQGILQGTLAWFEPDDRGAAKDVYYRLEGVVAIVGRLYGAVDFKVISANVSVVVHASAGLVMEAYRPFEITLSVGVSVGVSVRVAFVKVHFSFKMTLTERFTIGSRQLAPWDPPTRPVPARMSAARALRAGPEAVSDLAYTIEIEIEEEPAVDLNWDPIKLGDPKTLDIYVLVNLTKGMTRDDEFSADDPQTAGKKRDPFAAGRESTKLALTFFAQNSIVPESETHEDYHNVQPETEACAFNLLARGILAWAIQAGSEDPGNTTEVERNQLNAIYRCVSEKDSPHYKPFQIHQLYNFLKENFTFVLKTNSDKKISATIFPILPQLQLRTSDGKVERDFATYTPVSEHYHEKIKEFVAKLSVSLQEAPKGPAHDLRARGLAPAEKHDPSMAKVIFEDYFMMLMRATLQSAVDFMENYSHRIQVDDTLKTLEDQFSVEPQSIAAANRSASRILDSESVIQVKNLSYQTHFSDSLSSIAQKLAAAPAVTASALIAANRNRANILKTGGSLKLTQIEYSVPKSQTLGEILEDFQVPMANVRPLDGSLDVRDRPEQLSRWEIFNQVKTYERGKSLKEIADENGVPIDALRGLNPRLDQDDNTTFVTETEVTIPEIKFTPQAGETLEELACRFEFPAEKALKMNRLENVSDQIGDIELYLPNLAYLAPPRDTEAVLKYFGITLEALVSANTAVNFGKPLAAGQTLKIKEVNHTIAPNDTFLSIAVYYGSKLENLAADLANDRNILHPTAVLKIPDFGHHVQSEESLDSIARHYGQSFKDLVAANIKSNILKAGNDIIIPDVARLSIDKLLDGLANSGKFNHIAAMMSRFLLHGLRLPEDSGQGPATAPTRPLYTLIGQQFDAPSSDKYPEGYVVELSRPADDNWIEFDSTGKAASAEAGKFYLKLGDHLFELKEKLDQIRQFNLIGLDLGKIDLAPIRKYEVSPRRFNLRHRIAWQRPDPFKWSPDTAEPAIVSPSIWKLPANLTEWLETIQMESPPVTLKCGAPDHGRSAKAGKPVKHYRWSTLVNVQVKRLVPGGGTDPLPTTYLLLGTDEPGRRILEKLYVFLKSSSSTVKLDLLYPPHFAGPQPEGLQSDTLDISNTQIVKTNLSTQSHSRLKADRMIQIPGEAEAEIKSEYAASLDNPLQFVKLLWECSVVNTGGFYLLVSVQNQGGGLPAYLFEEDDQVNLTLLVRMAAEQDGLCGFHNSVFVLDNIDPSEGLYVEAITKPDDKDAAVSEGFMEKAATISPGHVGFRIERANPENNTPEGEPPAELLLQMLYNLLSFRIMENQDFNDSCEGLPAGPADLDDDRNGDKSERWRYEHVLPIYSFVKSAAIEKTPEKFPAGERDPYRVIGKKCELEFKFQDVFGNRVTPPKTEKGLNLAISSNYFDALIALSQWPAILAVYDISKTHTPQSESGDDIPAQLNIGISMDAGGYVPGPGKYPANCRTRAKADRETCARIFYQLRQQHVNLYVLNSINGEAKEEIRNKDDFVNFAGHAYAFLGNVQDLESYRDTIVNTNGKNDTLRSIAGSYHLDPVQLAEANRYTRNLFKNGTVTIPVYHIVKTGDTLRTIAKEKIMADLERLLKLNEHVPNVLRTDTPAVLDVITYQTQENESLTEIADKIQKKYETQGFEVPIAGIAYYNQEKSLNENLTLVIASSPGTYTVKSDLTLRELAGQLSDSVAEMAEANKTTKGLFKAGQNLKIPIVYHIKSNDTLTDLTKRYEKLEEFFDHNADNPDLLHAGSRLLVGTRTTPLMDDSLESIARQAGSMQNDSTQIKISVADIVRLNENLDLPLNPDLEASDAVAVYKQGELIIPGVFEVKTANNSESNNDPSIYRVKETDTLAAIASDNNCTPAELLLANCHHLGLLQEDAEFVIPDIPPAKKGPPSAGTATTGTDSIFKIRKNETPGSIMEHFADLTLTALAVALKDRKGILKTDALMLIPPAPVKIQVPVNTEPYPSHIFPLEVKLRIERDNDHIDSDFDDVPAVQAVETAIQPHQNGASFTGDDEPYSLETFARKFEAALPNLKLATGEKKYRSAEKKDEKKRLHASLKGRQTKDGARDSKTLWAVWLRTDGGGRPNDNGNSSKQPYNYRIQDRPIFFGLPPISTSLQSRQDVIIPLYEPDKGLATMPDKMVRINFSDVDMDLWARESLGAIDRFLQAEFAVPASQLHPAAFDSILMSKNSLADAISSGLVPIITTAQNDGNQASAPDEAFKQELLIELSRAYTTDAVVKYPVQIQAPITNPNDVPPRLCGRPQLNLKSGSKGAALQPEFTASTTKISLARGPSDLTFLFSTRNPARQRRVSLEFNFQVNELEFDINPLAEIPDSDYEASSWLRFILPIQQQDPRPLDIPVPMRSHPTLPALESQEIAASEKEGPLARIADWDYSFSYLHEAVAQDDVDCEVEFNILPPPQAQKSLALRAGPVAIPEPKDLLEALARFNYHYSRLSAVFNRLWHIPFKDLKPEKNPKAYAAIDAFSELVGWIASHWPRPAEKPRSLKSVPPPPGYAKYGYNLDKMIDDPATLQARPQDLGYGVGPKPQINSETPPQLDEMEMVTLGFKNLNALMIQNAWSGVRLFRNRKLIEGKQTNNKFIYTTPLMRFSSIARPLMQTDRFFDIAQLPQSYNSRTPPSTPIHQSLQKHLQVLFRNLIPAKIEVPFFVKTTVTYAYMLTKPEPQQQAGVLSAASLASADQDQPLQALVTSIPVVMIPEYPLANDSRHVFATGESEALTKGLATLLADTLSSWEKRKNPVREGGSYRFAVSFYAGGDTSQTLPLLELTQLWLDLDCIERPNS